MGGRIIITWIDAVSAEAMKICCVAESYARCSAASASCRAGVGRYDEKKIQREKSRRNSRMLPRSSRRSTSA